MHPNPFSERPQLHLCRSDRSLNEVYHQIEPDDSGGSGGGVKRSEGGERGRLKREERRLNGRKGEREKEEEVREEKEEGKEFKQEKGRLR